MEQAEAGDQLGILLRGVDTKVVKRGNVILSQGHSQTTTDRIDAQVYFLDKIYALKLPFLMPLLIIN